MLIGVDFDNTIVCYDTVFHAAAREWGLIPAEVPRSKGAVRDYLRGSGREDAWIELQGYVYGVRIADAEAFPGALEFFSACVRQGVAACIISHKTRHPYGSSTYDLHRAAWDWLESRGFLDPARIGLGKERIYLELTKQAKLARIAEVGCTHFVDDLPEFFAEPAFPAGVERILFDPAGACPDAGGCRRAASWEAVARLLGGSGRGE